MSGPRPHPDSDAREAMPPTTREAQLKRSEIPGDAPTGSSARRGRSGGALARDIATKDELEQAFELEGGKTHVHSSEEDADPPDSAPDGDSYNIAETRGLRDKASRSKN